MLAHVSPPDIPGLGAIWAPEHYQSILDSLRGLQVSIGISSQFDPGDGALIVKEVYPGSPADGVLLPRDRIMRIDGQALRGLTVARVNQMLSDDAGTRLSLTVVRDIEVLKVELVRERFTLQNVRAERLPDGITLISIRKISQNVSEQVRKILSENASKSGAPMHVIFDLRGNQGGLFIEGLKLAELFVPSPNVLLRALKNPEQVANYVSANKKPLRAEIIILMDKQSASASEVFAAALQAHGLARLVGTASFGKATLEETFRLDNDYRIKFIVGAMYDPRGRSWYKRGLIPDFYVEQQEDLHTRLASQRLSVRLGKDPQLNAAWKLLRESRTGP